MTRPPREHRLSPPCARTSANSVLPKLPLEPARHGRGVLPGPTGSRRACEPSPRHKPTARAATRSLGAACGLFWATASTTTDTCTPRFAVSATTPTGPTVMTRPLRWRAATSRPACAQALHVPRAALVDDTAEHPRRPQLCVSSPSQLRFLPALPPRTLPLASASTRVPDAGPALFTAKFQMPPGPLQPDLIRARAPLLSAS